MTTPVSSIIDKELYPSETMRVLSFFLDGRFEEVLVKTGHKFYGSQQSFLNEGYYCKDLKILPDNISKVHADMIFDCVIYNHEEAHGRVASQASDIFHIPRLLIQHFGPVGNIVPKLEGNIVFVHDVIRKQFGHDDGEVIPYGIEVPKYNDGERDIDVLIHGKFVQADYALITRVQEMQFKTEVYGDNPGISEEIHEAELNEKMSQTKVFLNLSNNISIPNSALRAMAHGCAVVSNENPITPELFEDCGVIVNKLKDFAPAINKVIDNNWKELGRVGRNIIIDNHTMEDVVSLWKDKLLELGQGIYTR